MSGFQCRNFSLKRTTRSRPALAGLTVASSRCTAGTPTGTVGPDGPLSSHYGQVVSCIIGQFRWNRYKAAVSTNLSVFLRLLPAAGTAEGRLSLASREEPLLPSKSHFSRKGSRRPRSYSSAWFRVAGAQKPGTSDAPLGPESKAKGTLRTTSRKAGAQSFAVPTCWLQL